MFNVSDLLEFMCVYIITGRSLPYLTRTLFLKQVGSDRVRTRNNYRVRLMSPGHHKTPRQVFDDKYLELLKQNGWGGGGKKLPNTWSDHEKT